MAKADNIEDVTETSNNIAVVTRFIDEVINGGNLDLIDQLWHDDLTWEGGSLGERHGIEAYKKMMGATNSTGRWNDLHLTVHNIVAHNDLVMVQFTNSGYRTGRLFGILPFRSKRGTWNGVGVYTLHNGKIAHAWFVEDVIAMLRGLGAAGALNLVTARNK